MNCSAEPSLQAVDNALEVAFPPRLSVTCTPAHCNVRYSFVLAMNASRRTKESSGMLQKVSTLRGSSCEGALRNTDRRSQYKASNERGAPGPGRRQCLSRSLAEDAFVFRGRGVWSRGERAWED